MTRFEVIPVTDRVHRERSQVIDERSYLDLLAENARLKTDADAWHNAWACAVNNRCDDRQKLQRAMRVLASLGRLSPRMAGLVEAARREVYGELP